MFVTDPGLPTAVRLGPLPLVVAALAAIAGALLARELGAAGVAIAGVGAASGSAFARRLHPIALALPAALGAFELQPRHAVEGLVPGPVRIEARVVGTVTRDLESGRLSFWMAAPGESRPTARAVVTLREHPAPDAVLPGDRIRGTGFLRPAASGERATWLPLVELELDALRVERGPVSPARLATHARFAAADALHECLSPERARLAAQLVLGQRSSVDDELVEAHRATGLAHLLAVSGAHAMLLALLLSHGYTLLRGRDPFRARGFRRVAAGILIGYGAITGFEAPVLRAIVAWLLLAVATARGRRATIGGALALPALVTAFVAPRELGSVGFCLSYAAVIGLCAAQGPRRAATLGIRIGAVLRASWWALLTTTPLTLLWFGQCAPWTLLGTPVLGPLVALMLGLGLVTVVLQGVAPPLATPVAALLEPCCAAYAWVVTALAEMPGAPILAWRHPSGVELFAMVMAGGAIVAIARSRRSLAIACVLCSLPHFLGPVATESAALRVCDVGHGQAVLVTLEDGRRALIDCGAMHSPRRAARAVLDEIDGPLGIDVAVLTHDDADHVGGFVALLSRLRVREAWVGAGDEQSEVARALTSHGCTVHVLIGGATRMVLPGVTVYAPDLPDGAKSNDRSLWTRIELGGLRVVLPGDAETDGIHAALAGFEVGTTDVLLLPHHGRGEREPNAKLLARARPALTIASCGDAEDPPLAPIARAAGATVLQTAVCGTITIHLDGSRAIVTERPPQITPNTGAEKR